MVVKVYMWFLIANFIGQTPCVGQTWLGNDERPRAFMGIRRLVPRIG